LRKNKREEENLISIGEEETISEEEEEDFKAGVTISSLKKMERAKVLKMKPAAGVLSEEGGPITIEEVGMEEEEEAVCSQGSASPAIRQDINPLGALKRLETIQGKEIGGFN
jgi:hypothetical protein